jgi:hypothetical protein
MMRTLGTVFAVGLCFSSVACKKEAPAPGTATNDAGTTTPAAPTAPATPATPDGGAPPTAGDGGAAPTADEKGFVKGRGTSECEQLRNCAKTWNNKEVTVKFCSLDEQHARLAAGLHLREGVTAMTSAECNLGCGSKAGCTAPATCIEQWNQTGARRATNNWTCSEVTGECEHRNKEMYECKRTYSSVYGNVFCNCVQ